MVLITYSILQFMKFTSALMLVNGISFHNLAIFNQKGHFPSVTINFYL